ncbi:hypothetical protein D3C76_1531530 [compost metagenome]
MLLIGENLDFAQVVQALYPSQEALGREVNPVVYGLPEFKRRLNDGDSFLSDVMARPRLFIQGVEDDFGKFAGSA